MSTINECFETGASSNLADFFIKEYPTPLIYISEVMIQKPSVCP